MGINALTIAWLSRLADKNVIKRGNSILEFGPQDVLCSREAVEMYARKHDPLRADQILEATFDGEKGRGALPRAFYSMFGISTYRSLDIIDPRADWKFDCNVVFKLPEQFDITTNYGTAEHVFGIGSMFESMHNVTRTGGVMLHILPAFGDVDHGFFNVHPTVYLDLAVANNYTIEDMSYVDRWDIRDKAFANDLSKGIDFDGLPIQMADLRHRPTLQRKVTKLFVENYNHPDTATYGQRYDGILYDYCVVALRKNSGKDFQFPMQQYYSDHGVASSIVMAGGPSSTSGLSLSIRTKIWVKGILAMMLSERLLERILKFSKRFRS